MDLNTANYTELHKQLQTKKISAVEVVRFFLEKTHKLNGRLNAFISINENAIKDAEKIDQQIATGENLGPLAGIPFAIKDLLCTKGIRTTAASKILSNFIPPYDATVVSRLKKSGAVILGKTNLDEFAMGSSNETSAFGPVKNPWNTEFVPGGSSGGSASAQAARMVMGSIGTDTGGSIRQPSSFCGIVGVKPTYGRVSRYGIVAYASSLDQAGPMVSSVEDAALVLDSICGKDSLDMTTANLPKAELHKSLNPNIKGMKIGLIKEYFLTSGIQPEVLKSIENAKENLKKLGAEFVDISIPLTEYAVPVYYLIAASECSSNLSRYDGVKYGFRADFQSLSELSLDEFYSQTRGQGFGTEVKRRIILGTYCLSSGYYDAYYRKACQVRRLLRQQFVEAFKSCDVILSPVTTSPAFKIGSRIYDPLTMYLNDIFTVSTNLSGLPGMSLPFSTSKDDLPLGVQLTASHFQEQKLLNVAFALESTTEQKGRYAHVS